MPKFDGLARLAGGEYHFPSAAGNLYMYFVDFVLFNTDTCVTIIKSQSAPRLGVYSSVVLTCDIGAVASAFKMCFMNALVASAMFSIKMYCWNIITEAAPATCLF